MAGKSRIHWCSIARQLHWGKQKAAGSKQWKILLNYWASIATSLGTLPPSFASPWKKSRRSAEFNWPQAGEISVRALRCDALKNDGRATNHGLSLGECHTPRAFRRRSCCGLTALHRHAIIGLRMFRPARLSLHRARIHGLPRSNVTQQSNLPRRSKVLVRDVGGKANSPLRGSRGEIAGFTAGGCGQRASYERPAFTPFLRRGTQFWHVGSALLQTEQVCEDRCFRRECR
jgi:hypothetical protein